MLLSFLSHLSSCSFSLPLYLIIALPVASLLYLIRPPTGLQALAPPATLSSLPAIPSYISFANLPSPTLFLSWLTLSLHLRTSPWKLRRQIVQAVDVDWSQEAAHDKEGKLLQAWDRIGYWSQRDGCLELSALKKWEALADPLADQALHFIQSQPVDTSTSVNDLLGRLDSSDISSEASSRFSSLVTQRRPLRGAGVISLAWYTERDARKGLDTPAWLHDELTASHDDLIPLEELQPGLNGQQACLERLQKVASWHDEEWEFLSGKEKEEELVEEARLIQLGQNVFYRYSGGILMSLLHFSLAGGFASPRLTGVLRATDYLVPAQRQAQHRNEERREALQDKEKKEKVRKSDSEEGEKTWRRLMETTQWVLDVMETVQALEPPAQDDSLAKSTSSSAFGGVGREATLSVRLLHSRVRTRVASKLSLPPDCLPLNQADLLATLLSFSAAPLASLSRMGMSLTTEEREAYLGIWRYIGWLMGVDDRLIRVCLVDSCRADRALWSCVLNLFSEEDVATQAAPTLGILTSIAARPPFYTSLPLHIALSSSLLGQTLSNALRLPPSPALVRLRVAATYMGMYLTTSFSKWYFPSTRGKTWEQKRDRCTRRLLRRLIVWNLGMHRSKFFGGSRGGEGLIPVERDETTAMKEVREYQWMIRELIAVHFLIGAGTVAVIAIGAWSYLRSSWYAQ